MADDSVHFQQHYSILKIWYMKELRELFPSGEADELNFVLFSTSGVHGHYDTIEDAEMYLEEHPSGKADLTVLVIHPRIVCLRYGTIKVGRYDIPWLKRLRESSWQAVQKIGMRAPA